MFVLHYKGSHLPSYVSLISGGEYNFCIDPHFASLFQTRALAEKYAIYFSTLKRGTYSIISLDQALENFNHFAKQGLPLTGPNRVVPPVPDFSTLPSATRKIRMLQFYGNIPENEPYNPSNLDLALLVQETGFSYDSKQALILHHPTLETLRNAITLALEANVLNFYVDMSSLTLGHPTLISLSYSSKNPSGYSLYCISKLATYDTVDALATALGLA